MFEPKTALKVSKSQKQIILSSHTQKNQRIFSQFISLSIYQINVFSGTSTVLSQLISKIVLGIVG
jgi:hypothetical protein